MKLKKPNFWDFKNPNLLAIILLPLSIIYLFIIKLRFKKKNKPKNINTICLGNIYVGGTGKTSLAIKIKSILEKQGKKVCFIKKFYKNQLDEQKILDKNGKVFIHKKRIYALEKAIAENYQIAIFDDGLQDISMEYDSIFVCFNNLNWIGNGLPIPAGPLRNSINSLKNFKNVFLNGNNENLDNIKLKLKSINPKLIIHEGKYIPLNLKEFDLTKNYIVFSGIGNHKTFLNMLLDSKFKILKDFEFPDHYDFLTKDLDKVFDIAEKFSAEVITTEKDYLRINNRYKYKISYIKSEIKIVDEKKLIKNLISHDK